MVEVHRLSQVGYLEVVACVALVAAHAAHLCLVVHGAHYTLCGVAEGAGEGDVQFGLGGFRGRLTTLALPHFGSERGPEPPTISQALTAGLMC